VYEIKGDMTCSKFSLPCLGVVKIYIYYEKGNYAYESYNCDDLKNGTSML
jgi:hypothetical protein